MVTPLEKLYKNYTGVSPAEIVQLSAAGSNRQYYRLKGDISLIGIHGVSPEENESFIYLSGYFKKKGLPVPEVYAWTDNKLFYIQEDLGDICLYDIITESKENGAFDEKSRAFLRETIGFLPAFQFSGSDGLDYSYCYPQKEFNHRTVFWDLNYFKYCFLKATGLEIQEDLLEDDFEKMASVLLSERTDTFMYRDFQSRNVMLKDNSPFFIDFQGGRKGPVYYDVASFLWQAKAGFPDQLKKELLDVYLDSLRSYMPVNDSLFRIRLNHFILFRTMQVLGAYGFRGYFERKEHFIQSVPYAIGNLRKILKENFKEYPYLVEILNQLTGLPQFVEKN